MHGKCFVVKGLFSIIILMDIIVVTLMVLLPIVSGIPILRLNVCSESEATFTCIVNESNELRWDISDNDMNRFTVSFFRSDTIGRSLYLTTRDTGVMYTFTLTLSSPLTSTVTTNTPTDLSGATILCSSRHSADVNTLALPGPPQPLNITLTALLRSEESDISISSYLHWSYSVADSLEDTVNLNTSYVISIFLESNQSNFTYTTSNTSIWLTLSYDQDYNISVVAKTCVGTSKPAELYLWDDQCPIPWENANSNNMSIEYSVSGPPRLVCNYLSGFSPQREIVSVCTSNGIWHPNLAKNVCTQTNIKDNTDVQHNRELLITVAAASITVIFLFLVVLSLTTTLFVTRRRKQYSRRSETQMADEAQNEYTEVEHTHRYQDEDLDQNYNTPHLELGSGHNQGDNHSTFTLISELQNPLYQNTTNNNDPEESLNLDSLLIQLRVQVTPKWQQFGAAIGVPEDLLQQYSNYPADECLIEILNYWLNNHQSPTWRDVAKVLRDIELNDLAEGIMNVYETGCLPVEVDADDSDSDDNILLPLPIPSNMLQRTSIEDINAGTTHS